MVRIAGIVIVLLGTTAFGIYKSCVYVNRLNNLYEIKKVFLYIQGEIRYMNTPMPEVLDGAAMRVKGQLNRFFRHVAGELNQRNRKEFREIWEETIRQELSGEVMEKEALSELCQVGGQLGCLDLKAQEKAIDYFLQKWEFIIEKRRKEKDGRLKLYYACGIMGGLLMVIILV